MRIIINHKDYSNIVNIILGITWFAFVISIIVHTPKDNWTVLGIGMIAGYLSKGEVSILRKTIHSIIRNHKK